MKPNFNNCSNIKGLRFFASEISPYYCCFLHTKKNSGGVSIHRINELFPLKPSLDRLQRLFFNIQSLYWSQATSWNCSTGGSPTTQRCVCHFPFRWIYYYGSNESTGKETENTRLCTSLVSARNSTSTSCSAIGIKFVLVEFSLCTTQLKRFLHSTLFFRSQKLY